MKIYTYSKCGSCRKAINWLNANKFEFEMENIIENPPSRDSLIKASIQLGDRKYIFNTSGQSYRKLGAKMIKELSDDKAFDALAADPKLIKRPFFIVDNENYLVGFNESVWSSALLT